MVSDLAMGIFIIALLAIAAFLSWSVHTKRMYLLHKLYLFLAVCYAIWIIPLIGIRYTSPDNQRLMFFWDCLMQPGGHLSPAIYLCIAIIFVKGYEHMTKWMKALFIVPCLSVIVSCTNPLHHLQYQVFSTVRSEIVFGPYVMISGLCSYIYLTAGIVLMIRFAVRNHSALYLKQCILFSVGGLCPLVVSAAATFSGMEFPITATPLSFMVPLITNGIAIYQLHMLDIRPIATQHILDWISDGYLVVSDKGLVISYNKQFAAMFAPQYGIMENRFLSDCVKKEDISKKTAIYNMITAIEESREARTVISYEQAVTVSKGSEARKSYFITDVAPLILNDKIAGFVILFKDITQVKISMQQLQNSQERMMEQERLAFLGQMIGGLAHNLKTPIMGISGCISAAEALVQECEDSLGDPQVEEADYREIYGEIRDWFQKMRESAAYMSDIITAIKGQAANAVTFEDSTFTIDEVLRRSQLLMRHELLSGNCQLITECDQNREILLRGDINNLIQVLDNLLSNAIYAQKQVGGGRITAGVQIDEEDLKIYVKDTGPGVSESVRERLFKAMVTSKGTMGTGLGLYISNAVIRGKFGGTMWMKDNPEGGSIFGISIPKSLVTIKDAVQPAGGMQDEKK